MAHAICSTTGTDEFDYFRGLWDRMFAPDLDLETRLERLFATETTEFDLEYAFFARIDQSTETEVLEVVHGPGIEKNDTAPLSETYCRRTITEPDGTFVIDEASAEGWEDDPAYERYGLESYVGTTVTLDGELYGTLCFANRAARSEPLDEREIALIEMFGEWVTYELNRRASPRGHEAPGTPAPLSSSQIDAMMNALGSPERRSILLSLLDGTTGCSLDTLYRVVDADGLQLRLHHTHLPKLAEAGYIRWDHDDDVILRGPNFAEIEPLLRLLERYLPAP